MGKKHPHMFSSHSRYIRYMSSGGLNGSGDPTLRSALLHCFVGWCGGRLASPSLAPPLSTIDTVPTSEDTQDFLKKKLEKPCPNHAFLVKHLYKDCVLKKEVFSGGFKGREPPKKLAPTGGDNGEEEKDGGFSKTYGYLMIFRVSTTDDTKR